MGHEPYWLGLMALTAVCALMALILALSRKGRSEDQARAYLAGFAYVLSDDADGAIAELSRAAQLNTQALETYFALGALFRRKGELDRAIRLHRNILLRPGVSQEVKLRAELALVLDYRRSGLKDKAAEVLEKLLEQAPENREALLAQRQIFEEQGQWEKAIETQSQLIRVEGKGEEVLSYLLSEWSRMLVLEKPAEAEKMAQRAVQLNPKLASPQLALGQARLALGMRLDAAEPLMRAVEMEPELATRALPLLAEALKENEVRKFLTEQISRRPDRAYALELGLALHQKDCGEVDMAIARLRRLVERKPTLWEARRELGALLLANGRSEELRADYAEVLEALGQPVLTFVCSWCKQNLPEHAFRCMNCGSWGTIARGELNLTPESVGRTVIRHRESAMVRG